MQLFYVRVIVMFLGINFDEKPSNTDQMFPFVTIIPKYHDISFDI